MSPLWFLPAAVLVLGVAAAGIAARRLAAEAAALRPALAGVRDLRPAAAGAAAELRSAWAKGSSLAVVDRFRTAGATLRWRRPGR